jgi:hypothetical protein
MHALIVKVKIHDFERAHEFLTTQIVPNVKQAPGFVAGYWASPDRARGESMVVFESEEGAQTVKQMIESDAGPGPGDEVSLESVEIAEVVASA